MQTPKAPSYVWSESAGRYRNTATGRFVPERVVLREVDKVYAASAQTMKGLTQSLVDGDLSLPEWQRAMEAQIKMVNRIGGVAARGGLDQMTQADWGHVGAQTKRQYQYFRNFAAEIASGKQKLNGTAVTRAGLYGEAGRGTYQEGKRRQAKRKGYNEERRMLGFAEHCPDCVKYAQRGWQPIGTLPRIGDSQCRTYCKCFFTYRTREE